MSCLSIVIPVLNEGETIDRCLREVRQAVGDEAELIVVDGGSEDSTVAVATPIADQLIRAATGRANQMNAGARVASGDYLLFLHADTQLPGDFPALIGIWAAEEVKWGFFPVKLSGQHWLLRWVEKTMSCRSLMTGIGTGDQCLYVRKEIFQQLGGYPQQPLMEDIALCKKLKKISRPRVEAVAVVTSSRRWEEQGIVKTILEMWALRLAYFCGVSTDRLVQVYYPERKLKRSVATTHYRFPKSCIVQFAKTPVAGEVKTRLMTALGPQGSLILHKALLERQLKLLHSAAVAPVELWFSKQTSAGQGVDGEHYFDKLVEGADIRLQLQSGVSLGDRMADCFRNRLSEYKNVVLVGSDCPAITGDYISRAIAALNQGADAVFGPALDGGYVLVALGQMSVEKLESVFANVSWGTGYVMSRTRQNLLESGLSWHELEVLQDVDREEDLPALEGYICLNEIVSAEIARN